MKKEYISIVIGVLTLALVGQGIWLFRIYQGNHANDFEIESYPSPLPSEKTRLSLEGRGPAVGGGEGEPFTWSQKLISQSHKLISAAPGKTLTLSATFQNTGTATWTNTTTFLQILAPDEADSSPWYHKSWPGKKRVAALKEESVEPTAHGTFTFSVVAPSIPGTYTLAFRPIYQVNNKYTWLGANPALSFTIDVHIQKE